MLQLDNLSYRWPHTSNNCISDLSLQLTPGEWVALVGDNGAGKSTLLRLAAGLLTPNNGEVRLKGQHLADYSAPQRANHIGVLFQEAERQIFYNSVFDEVAFGLRRQKLPSSEVTRRTQEALVICGLEDVATQHPLDLHAGQRRMVAVACLCATAPSILLLDEPSRDFDAYWLSRFEYWLETQRAAGTAILAISHDLDFIARHFPRVIHLDAGTLIADGSPEQVLRAPALQPPSVLPAPTLYALSEAQSLALESDPHRWAQLWLQARREQDQTIPVA
ncbi:ABC transporter ATP-binding protein [Citrobacter sp. JGM124]|uniref:energy-coupling factor ABC transporter ATP-binding protein n=1 Tax=Citrobacter sp. JGM124 TaxID=2799789 RepID=UPI001BAAFEEF|nr:ABC transporter ATP-binding protein [Citrobacter sp. JGM124]MBS0847932.1 ABC transporter ATP-binding protein [Citrobacter sp. JGM124]